MYFPSPTIASCQSMGALWRHKPLGAAISPRCCFGDAQQEPHCCPVRGAGRGMVGSMGWRCHAPPGQPNVSPAAHLLAHGAGLSAELRCCQRCGLWRMLSVWQPGLERKSRWQPELCSSSALFPKWKWVSVKSREEQNLTPEAVGLKPGLVIKHRPT